MDIAGTAEQKEEIKVEFMKPAFGCHTFYEQLESERVLFSVIQMQDSVYVWIGYTSDPSLSSLAMAMPNTTGSGAIDVSILESSQHDYSKAMALRLTKKLNKQVYFSFNIPDDKFVIPSIEKRLYKEIEQNPNKF